MVHDIHTTGLLQFQLTVISTCLLGLLHVSVACQTLSVCSAVFGTRSAFFLVSSRSYLDFLVFPALS